MEKLDWTLTELSQFVNVVGPFESVRSFDLKWLNLVVSSSRVEVVV